MFSPFLIRKPIGSMISELISPSDKVVPGFQIFDTKVTPADPAWNRHYVLRAGGDINDLSELMRTGEAICIEPYEYPNQQGRLRVRGYPNFLFLDIDGVGCAYPDGRGHAEEFTQLCALQLQRIHESCPGLMAVIISERRRSPEEFDKLKRMFIDSPCRMQIAGATPDFSGRQDIPSYSRRAHEVKWFADTWRTFFNATAGADDEIFGYEDVEDLPQFFHPDKTTGLTERVADDIIHHFNSQLHYAPR